MLAMLALLVAGAFALVVFGLGRVPSHRQVALLVAAAAAAVCIGGALGPASRPVRARGEATRPPGAWGARGGAAGVRYAAVPRAAAGRTAAPTRRAAAAKGAPGDGRGVDRQRQPAGTSRLRSARRGLERRPDRWRASRAGAGRCLRRRVGGCVVAGARRGACARGAARRADRQRGRAARLDRRATSSGGAAVRRGGRARPGRARPAGRTRVSQSASGLRAAGLARRAAGAGRGASRLTQPRRRSR